MEAKITLDRDFVVGDVDNRLYGSFIEHLGRAIYGGIWEPGHAAAGQDGFRTDVLDLVRELNVPVVRYPGGNFVSAYNWEDGVGPVEDRPKRLDLAWKTFEPNRVGTNEFVAWCRKANTEPMMAVNLGSRGIDAARDLVEYCNFPGGSHWSDLRISHGYKEPHDIRLWCLGNEMDGPWQVGHKTAFEYGRLADETAKAIKYLNPDLEVVACGSSGTQMSTFPMWEQTILDECYDNVDYVSLHAYVGNRENDLLNFLATPLRIEQQITTVIHACDFVKAKKRSKKDIQLSFDEWNVWFHSNESDKQFMKDHAWSEAPPILEDIYTFEDALVVGGIINAFLRHADRVKIACLAQLVNVIAPIMTETGGTSWRQTIYFPFLYASQYGRGTSINAVVSVPKYENDEFGNVPYLDVSAVLNEAETELSLFVVNRNPEEGIEVSVRCGGFPKVEELTHISMTHSDIKATNTAANPENVVPHSSALPPPDGETVVLDIPKCSWNCFVLKL